MYFLPKAALAALASGLLASGGGFSLAHDDAAMFDPDRARWFESLKVPGTDASCCNLDDCFQSEARQEPDGSWVAVVAGKWRAIPPEKVLTTPFSIDGEAYVCHSAGYEGGEAFRNGAMFTMPPSDPIIYCFVPPIPGF